MTTQEIAILKGVPMPETCKDLNWQNKTNYYYYNGLLCDRLRFNDLTGYWFALPIDDDGLTFFKSKNKSDFLPAPQMHEIAPLLPKEIDSYLLQSYNDFLGYQNPANEVLLRSNVVNWNFAQAYAEMYLKLKNEGITS